MSKTVSFIIPVYNVEKYLRECVDSILCQLTDECEIILVDDGSTDKSGDICDECSALNKNIVVIHQRNAGHSAARNVGLDRAQGRYVAFIDSDDYIGQGSVTEIIHWTKTATADICFMEGFKLFPDGITASLGDEIDRNQIRGKTREEVFQHLATRPKYPGSACTKLFRRAFLNENGLRFPTNLTHAEDLTLCLQCFLKADQFDLISWPYYYYRQGRAGSMTSSINANSFEGLKRFVEFFSENLTDKNRKPYDKICECALSFVAYEYSILLWQYFRVPDKKSTYKQFLRDKSWCLNYGKSKKTHMIRLLYKICGINLSSMILDVYMRVR